MSPTDPAASSTGLPLDALVVGGGPAGLAAALYLARFRRRVLLVDNGHSRVATIPRTHNYPGFVEGVAGDALLSTMRRQAAHHGVQFASGLVESLSVAGEVFRAEWRGGDAAARKVLLASGVSDVPPAMPHLAQALQEGALRYCPVCDGFEVIGCDVGVLVDHGSDVGEALYLRHFTDRLTLFPVHDGVHFDAHQRSQLDDAGVMIAADTVSAIRLQGDGRISVRHGANETVLDSLYAALGMRVHSGLATRLGAQHHDGYLLTDHHQQTTVPGLYAAGDVVKGLNQITVGVGEAAVAASAIHLSLLKEDSKRRSLP
jgi:thioredoxin reductase (NADPH)